MEQIIIPVNHQPWRHFFNVVAITFLAFSLNAAADRITVGPNDEDFANIQAAIDAAAAGDEIVVSPGTYTENINLNGKNLVLRSNTPTSNAIVQTTIIDGGATGAVATFSGNETADCLLAGFTLTNGTAPGNGGAINGNETAASIRHNVIFDNSASGNGGGIAECDGTIEDNQITSNTARFGGGLYRCNGIVQRNAIFENTGEDGAGLHSCNGTADSNSIRQNTASRNGGGLYACDGTIQNNLIHENAAASGGGLFLCSGFIQNNTIYANTAEQSGGGLRRCIATLRNLIIWENRAQGGADQISIGPDPDYSCIEDWSGGGIGNISNDPLFVDAPNGNFRLNPGSPCIDRGIEIPLNRDFDGNPRPLGSGFDIGAFEFVPDLTGLPTPIWTHY